MSEAAIRAAVYAAVGGVSNVGKVYDNERWANNWDDFLTLFKTTISSTNVLRGWMTAYRGFESESGGYTEFGNNTGFRAHRFVVFGFIGLKDADSTEKAASALAEAVCDALDADSTLHGATYDMAQPVQLAVFEPRQYGSVLCHYAEIAVTVSEYVTN